MGQTVATPRRISVIQSCVKAALLHGCRWNAHALRHRHGFIAGARGGRLPSAENLREGGWQKGYRKRNNGTDGRTLNTVSELQVIYYGLLLFYLHITNFYVALGNYEMRFIVSAARLAIHWECACTVTMLWVNIQWGLQRGVEWAVPPIMTACVCPLARGNATALFWN